MCSDGQKTRHTGALFCERGMMHDWMSSDRERDDARLKRSIHAAISSDDLKLVGKVLGSERLNDDVNCA